MLLISMSDWLDKWEQTSGTTFLWKPLCNIMSFSLSPLFHRPFFPQVNMCPVQRRADRSRVGHNERQSGERHERRAHKSERLFSVINMEIAGEEKACNREISALLPVLTFFFLPPPPSVPPVKTSGSLMCVNDQRIQDKANYYCAVRTSSKTVLNLCSCPH